MSHFHLRGLDGLRALAATSVVVGHIELLKKENGFANGLSFVSHIGHLSVVLFFVLSGFLITTLLLRERKKEGTVNIKHFYIRRILRVWPLYYLILALGLLLFSYRPETPTLVLCLSIFPNIAHALGYAWLYSPQVWSIGVEEQFYLLWPALMKYNKKYLLPFVLAVFLCLPLMPHAIQFLMARFYPNAHYMELVENIFEVLKFDCMAMGAILAILFFNGNAFLRKITEIKPLSVFLVFLPLALWFCNVRLGMFSDFIYAILFSLMILCIVTGNISRFFDVRPLRFLGKISYGIYMYHWIIILLVLKFIVPSLPMQTWYGQVGFSAMVLGSTIIVSALSYYLLEKKLLDLKDRFSSEK